MTFSEQPAAPSASGETLVTSAPAVVETAIEPKEISAAPVVRPVQAIYVENEDVAAEYTKRDASWPPLTLITKTSSLARTFGIGAWVVNKEHKIGTMDTPLRVVAMRLETVYQEDVVYGSGVRPRIFSTAVEAAEAGFSTTNWDAEKVAKEVAAIRFWLPQPEGIDLPNIFTLESPEGPGTVVKYFSSGTGFKTVGRELKEAVHPKTGFLRKEKGGIVNQWWNLTATQEQGKAYDWLQPRLKVADSRPSEALKDFLRGIQL